jgi:multidrug efflux system membrane fusion protein
MSGRAILKQPKGNEGSSASTIKVPNSAIFTDNLNHTYVWVIDPKSHTVHKKPVKIDEANKGDFAIILEGLAPGEWVVTAGSSFLSEGQQVKMAEERTKP